MKAIDYRVGPDVVVVGGCKPSWVSWSVAKDQPIWQIVIIDEGIDADLLRKQLAKFENCQIARWVFSSLPIPQVRSMAEQIGARILFSMSSGNLHVAAEAWAAVCSFWQPLVIGVALADIENIVGASAKHCSIAKITVFDGDIRGTTAQNVINLLEIEGSRDDLKGVLTIQTSAKKNDNGLALVDFDLYQTCLLSYKNENRYLTSWYADARCTKVIVTVFEKILSVIMINNYDFVAEEFKP